MKKIGIFTSYFAPHLGGVESYVLSLSRHLKENGFEPIIVTCNTNNRPAREEKDVLIFRLDCWHLLGNIFPVPKFNQKNKKLLSKFFEENPDLIMTQTRFFPLSFWGAYLAKKHHLRLLHVEHGSRHVVLSNFLRTFVFHFYDHFFGGYVIRGAETNLVISRPGMWLVKHLGAKKVLYVPNSIDLDKFPKADSKKEKKIIFVGRLIEQKGVQDLIRAFKRLDLKDWRLIIVGDGPYREALKTLVGKNRLISFTGLLEEKEVIKNLLKAAILVNPSYLEGLPTSVLEAIAAKVTVIATNVGGTPDIIKNGQSGLLFEPKDISDLERKIKLLAKDALLRKKLSRQASLEINHFSWPENMAKLIKVIK